jgi:CHAT domain-containing protein
LICWKAPVDVADVRRDQTRCLTDAQVADYQRKLDELPALQRRREQEAEEARKAFGDRPSPQEEQAIAEAVARLKDGKHVDHSLSALGNGYVQVGRLATAEALYKRVIKEVDYGPADYLESYRPPMWMSPSRISYRLVAFLDVAYPELIKLLIARGKVDEALEYADRSRSKLLHAVIARRLNGGKPPATFSDLTAAQIRAMARQTATTFIVYMMLPYPPRHPSYHATKPGKSELYAWVVQPSGKIHFESLPMGTRPDGSQGVGGDPIGEVVSAFTSTLTRGVVDRLPIRSAAPTTAPPMADSGSALQRLHAMLIERIAQYLPQNPEQPVVIVPDGSLYLVPFNALIDKSGSSLVERYAVALTPSLAIHELLRKQRKQRINWKDAQSVLIVGDPKMPPFPRQIANAYASLPQLTGAATEAQAIATMFRAKALIGDAAQEDVVMQQMQQAQLIHFATHGLLISAALMTTGNLSASLSADLPPGGIVLAENPKSNAPRSENDYTGMPANGFLASGKILTLKLDAELVTLSACDTARGRTVDAQFVGLPSALLAAGARTVVMTLWSIPDAPTSELMITFYKALISGQPKAVALRRAVLATRERHVSVENWGAFTLVGIAE